MYVWWPSFSRQLPTATGNVAVPTNVDYAPPSSIPYCAHNATGHYGSIKPSSDTGSRKACHCHTNDGRVVAQQQRQQRRSWLLLVAGDARQTAGNCHQSLYEHCRSFVRSSVRPFVRWCKTTTPVIIVRMRVPSTIHISTRYMIIRYKRVHQPQSALGQSEARNAGGQPISFVASPPHALSIAQSVDAARSMYHFSPQSRCKRWYLTALW